MVESYFWNSPPFRTNDERVGNTLGFSARGGNQCTEGASSRYPETPTVWGRAGKHIRVFLSVSDNEWERMYMVSPGDLKAPSGLLRNQNKRSGGL